MSLTDFMKAAFGIVFGYDLDAAVAVFDEERRRPGSTSPSMDYASLPDDMMDCFGYPQPYYFSLSGQVPSRTLVAWRARRSGVV